MRLAVSLVVLLLLVLPLPAQPTPDTPEAIADQVLVALTAGDREALAEIAARARPDPWRTADELYSRGELDAAGEFARAAPRPDTRGLPAWLRAMADVPYDSAARAVLAAASQSQQAGRFEEAHAAVSAIEHRADDVLTARIAWFLGQSHRALSDLAASVGELERCGDIAARIGWLSMAFTAYHYAGVGAHLVADYAEAERIFRRQAEVARLREDAYSIAMAASNLAVVAEARGELSAAAVRYREAVEVFREMGSLANEALMLGNLAGIEFRLGETEKGMASLLTARDRAEESGHPKAISGVLTQLGGRYEALGETFLAIECLERCREIATRERDHASHARATAILGRLARRLGDHPRAIDLYTAALADYRRLGMKGEIAKTVREMGLVQSAMGRHRSALASLEEARRMFVEISADDSLNYVLAYLGGEYRRLGEYARALECFELAYAGAEKSGDVDQMATVLGNTGIVHQILGDHERARQCYERGLELKTKVDDRIGMATAERFLGLLDLETGAPEAARDRLRSAADLLEETPDRIAFAYALIDLAQAHIRLEEPEEALALLSCATEVAEEADAEETTAVAHFVAGHLWLEARDYDLAGEHYLLALGAAEETEQKEVAARCRWKLAAVELARGNHAEAVPLARAAADALPSVVGRLGEEQGAAAREEWTGVYDIGAVAAGRTGDLEALNFFLESGRAGSLLEGIGGREALWEEVVPAALLDREAKARAAESVARARHQEAKRKGKRKDLRQAKLDLESAEVELQAAVEAVQRSTKLAGGVVCPVADELDEIQARLGPDEALVTYGLPAGEALALVATEKETRLCHLGSAAAIEGAVQDLADRVREGDPAEAALTLRSLLIEPLDLPPGTRRLLISPSGPLGSVPFALLAGELALIQVPSATTYGVLLRGRGAAGTGRLAVGDPVYADGSGLSALPATRREAQAVGGVVLLGEEATEANFASELAKQGRWRAVHLACHGLVDPERPQLSSLALTAEGDDDGLLTCLEVFRMRVPADLVVLSACETARGKVYRTEGVMSLARAFMTAGASRVLCSLWKVDDEATRELMRKFYELWDPEDGEGLPADVALRQAQEHVRSQKMWAHPRYWAAWVLWGLS